MDNAATLVGFFAVGIIAGLFVGLQLSEDKASVIYARAWCGDLVNYTNQLQEDYAKCSMEYAVPNYTVVPTNKTWRAFDLPFTFRLP